MFNFSTKSLALILSLFIISSLGGYIIYAWTGPTSAPPGSNAPQPLNVGTTDQDKAARISATEFYDADNSSFYINPSGDSSISGALTLGGDISDGTKTIYDSASGRVDYSVLPYHKGDLTSDWASNSSTSEYYDVVNVADVRAGVAYGRNETGEFNAGVPVGWSGVCIYYPGAAACPAAFPNEHEPPVVLDYGVSGGGARCNLASYVCSCSGQGCQGSVWTSAAGTMTSTNIAGSGYCSSLLTYTYCCE